MPHEEDPQTSWGPLIAAVAVAEDMHAPAASRFEPPAVQARAPVFIGIDVKPDATVGIRVWRGAQLDSVYATCTVAQALRRQLPEALAEAVAMAITRLPQGPT